MGNKTLVYLAIGVFVLVLVGSVIISSGILNLSGNTIKNPESGNSNLELEKYRSEDIPEECRLPETQSDLNSWIEHLGHHKETFYCLDYFE